MDIIKNEFFSTSALSDFGGDASSSCSTSECSLQGILAKELGSIFQRLGEMAGGGLKKRHSQGVQM